MGTILINPGEKERESRWETHKGVHWQNAVNNCKGIMYLKTAVYVRKQTLNKKQKNRITQFKSVVKRGGEMLRTGRPGWAQFDVHA